jgi:hypothetical protein
LCLYKSSQVRQILIIFILQNKYGTKRQTFHQGNNRLRSAGRKAKERPEAITFYQGMVEIENSKAACHH